MMIDCNVDYLFFVAKDSVDQAAMAAACLMGCGKILEGKGAWSAREVGLFLSIIFLPAFLFRERVIDMHCLHRGIHALSIINLRWEESRDVFISDLQKILSCDTLSFKINEAKE